MSNNQLCSMYVCVCVCVCVCPPAVKAKKMFAACYTHTRTVLSYHALHGTNLPPPIETYLYRKT